MFVSVRIWLFLFIKHETSLANQCLSMFVGIQSWWSRFNSVSVNILRSKLFMSIVTREILKFISDFNTKKKEKTNIIY